LGNKIKESERLIKKNKNQEPMTLKSVKITKKDGTVLEGIVLPGSDEKTLVLKLEHGYNIGIHRNQIKEMKEIKGAKAGATKKKAQKPQKSSKKLPTITILHTGGTIASSVDYTTGAVSAHFSPEDLTNMFPELGQLANLQSKLIRNMMSESMRFGHYNLMAKHIEDEVKKGVRGVIITHGTDALHYTSAALSFMLEGLNIPVLLVGAQRSSDRGSSDAAMNLLNAVYFITNSDFAGVAICMHANSNDNDCLILQGTKVRKMHTSRRDAFRPINVPPIAKVNFEQKTITYIQKTYPKQRDQSGKFTLKLLNEKLKVGMLKTHTHMYASEVEAYKNFDGLVVEGMGIGQIPNRKFDDLTEENEKILKAVAELAKKMIVVWAPQTIYGRAVMNVYTEGRMCLEAGMIGNFCDMTPETAFIKLAWLLSNYKKEEAKELFGKNLRGEITDRTLYEEHFLY